MNLSLTAPSIAVGYKYNLSIATNLGVQSSVGIASSSRPRASLVKEFGSNESGEIGSTFDDIELFGEVSAATSSRGRG